MEIRPITLKDANQFIKTNHRHHAPVTGCRFAISSYDDGKLIGVAICGRPLSRFLDNGLTLEITRLCTNGTKNTCSFLYGACCRVAKAMGYKKVITYILMSENGASLRASNFVLEAENAGGKAWTGKRKPKSNIYPAEMKKRYAKTL